MKTSRILPSSTINRAGVLRGSGLHNSLGRAGAPTLARPIALRPLRVAQDLEWCEYDYPRWGAHNNVQLQLPPCSAHRLLTWGRSFHDTHVTGLRPFALPRPDALSPLPAAPVRALWVQLYPLLSKHEFAPLAYRGGACGSAPFFLLLFTRVRGSRILRTSQ
jgi:hypothetical protein